MTVSDKKPPFGNPVKHDGVWVVVGDFHNPDDPSDYGKWKHVPCITQHKTNWGNIEWRMKVRINGKKFRLQSRNDVLNGSSRKFTGEEMREWLDYAARLRTVYYPAFEKWVEETDPPSDPTTPADIFVDTSVASAIRDENQAPLAEDQLRAIARVHGVKYVFQQAKSEYYNRLEHTWEYSYWSPAGKVTKEIHAESREKADEKARSEGIDIENADVTNAAFGEAS